MVWEGNLPHNTNNPPMEAPVHPARQGWNRTSAYQGIPTSVELVDNSFKEQVNRFVNEFKLMSMAAATNGSNHISISFDRIKALAPSIDIDELSSEFDVRGYKTEKLEESLKISW